MKAGLLMASEQIQKGEGEGAAQEVEGIQGLQQKEAHSQHSPIHGRNLVRQLAMGRHLPLRIHIRINAARLLKRGHAAAHPRRATRELVVRRKDGPVEREAQRHEAIHGAHRLVAQEGLRQGREDAAAGERPCPLAPLTPLVVPLPLCPPWPLLLVVVPLVSAPLRDGGVGGGVVDQEAGIWDTLVSYMNFAYWTTKM